MDLVLSFELFSIGERKTEASNWYIFDENRNWSEINQIAQYPCIRQELLKFKLTNQNSASGKNRAIRRHVNCYQ